MGIRRLLKVVGLTVGVAACATVFVILEAIARYGSVILFEKNALILDVEMGFAAVGVCVCFALALDEVLRLYDEIDERRGRNCGKI